MMAHTLVLKMLTEVSIVLLTSFCAAFYTFQLSLDTFPASDEMQIGDRMCAAGAASCSALCENSEAEKIRGVPVLIITMPNTLGTLITLI